MSSRDKNPQVYVRGFSRRSTKDDLKDIFRKYGKIKEVQLKNDFAFIVHLVNAGLPQEYYDYYDAEEAIERMHGRTIEGYKLIVEPAGRDRKRENGRGPQPDDECWYCHKTGHW